MTPAPRFSLFILIIIFLALASSQKRLRALNASRADLAGCAVGQIALFAGGWNGISESALVDIYDATTDNWSTSSLSQPRYDLASACAGTYALFAGGISNGTLSDVVDIYDATRASWTASRLTVARHDFAAAAVGNKVLFAGGMDEHGQTNLVDVFDVCSQTWSVTRLSRPRAGLSAVAFGTRAYFAGGTGVIGSQVVDVYEAVNGSWTTMLMSQARAYLSTVQVGTKIFFAGGEKSGKALSVVDVYDTVHNAWSTARLSRPRFDLSAASLGTKALFAGGYDGEAASEVVDIYDLSSNTWSFSALESPRAALTALSVGSEILVAGGLENRAAASSLVEMFDPFLVKFENVKPKNPSSIVLALLAGIVVLALVATFVTILYFRKMSIVSNAGLVFLSIIFAGLVIGASQVFLWINEVNDTRCAFVPIFAFGAYALVIGPILAKLFRYFRIYKNTSLLSVPASTMEILIAVAVVVGLEVIILILWTALPSARLRETKHQTINSRDATITVQNRCGAPSDTGIWAILTVQLLFTLGTIVGGIFLALSTRKIHSRVAWGELRWLSFALYNMTFWCLIIALLMGLLRDLIVPMTVAVCLCFLLMCVFTAALVYGSKVYFILFKRALLEAGGDAEFSTHFAPDSIANAKDD